jgi:hypothetical protein
MSCLPKFPSPSLMCLLQLMRAARQKAGLQEILLRVISLLGSVVQAASLSDEDVAELAQLFESDYLPRLESELTEALEKVGVVLESDAEDDEVDEAQVWEILLPILINFAIELIREWLKNRRAGGGRRPR